MRLSPQHCALFSALTLVVACGDDAVTPLNLGGSGGGGSGGGNTGGASAGTPSMGGSSAGMTMAGSGPAAGTNTGGSAAGTAGSGGALAGAGGAAGSGGGGGTGGKAADPVCGNSAKEGAEACDDGGKVASDGCSATCTLEAGYVCNTPGAACTPVCGDGMKLGAEACDDHNTAAGDGCSATCTLEAGWECKTVGAACTTKCGDGVLAGYELCDDKNILPSDGCNATCVPEVGFVCDVPGEACRTKPDCTGGVCLSTCGDGLVIGEDCDDGNAVNDDGCSDACLVEADFTCKTVAAPIPDTLAIPVTYRDFVSVAMGGSTKFPDQQAFSGNAVTPGMVEATLDAGGLPVYTGVCEVGAPGVAVPATCPFGAQSTSKANFDMWYRTTADQNLAFPGVVSLTKVANSNPVAFVFDGGQTFTPLTGRGWDAQGKEGLVGGKNFGFTTELRYFFLYQGDEKLDFSGDDDVWVFINNKLAVDIGGLHPKQTKSLTIGAQVQAQLGLTIGKVYELTLFHAERAPGESNFKLTLTGFLNNKSVCTAN